jgi:hypothetical protein
MSEFMPDQVTAKSPERGPEAYLSTDERKALQRSLSFPEDLPPKFRSWLIDFIAVNIPQIPISQIVGFTQFTAKSSTVLTTDEITSTSYVDAATVGPQIEGLSDGSYVMFYGFQLGEVSNLTSALMSPSINAATPSDDDAARTRSIQSGTARGVLKTLAGGGNNTVKMQYKRVGGSDGDFERRWLIVLKVGN